MLQQLRASRLLMTGPHMHGRGALRRACRALHLRRLRGRSPAACPTIGGGQPRLERAGLRGPPVGVHWLGPPLTWVGCPGLLPLCRHLEQQTTACCGWA